MLLRSFRLSSQRILVESISFCIFTAFLSYVQIFMATENQKRWSFRSLCRFCDGLFLSLLLVYTNNNIICSLLYIMAHLRKNALGNLRKNDDEDR